MQRTILSSLLAGEPVQRLGKRLEHLDEQEAGQSLLELTSDGPDGLLVQTQSALYDLVVDHEHAYVPSHVVRMLVCMRIPKYLRVAHMCVRIPVAMPAAPTHSWWRLLSPLVVVGAILTPIC